jgi:hypothetical protein
MAKATVTCKCITCGEEYTRTKFCRNSAEADSWVAWVKENPGECYDCYKKAAQEAADEKVAAFMAEYELPEITGKSEKQIKYAADLRGRYICKFLESGNIKKAIRYATTLIEFPQEQWEEKAAENGITVEQMKERVLEHYNCKKIYIVLTTGEARTLIDNLR